MKINIVTSKILRLLISDDIALEQADDESLRRGRASFSTKVDFEPNCFYVTFDLTLKTEEDKIVNVVYQSEFTTDIHIDEQFRKSDFPYVNAPAIAYPFLRAFVSNLTLNSGYSPVMLPSVNFVAMKDRVIRPDQ